METETNDNDDEYGASGNDNYFAGRPAPTGPSVSPRHYSGHFGTDDTYHYGPAGSCHLCLGDAE